MARKIFVNLPVQSLERSVAFFTALGFSFNAHFTDETATCMIVADDIFVMLLTHDKFQQFTPKQLCDTKVATEVLVCLSAESRGEVDALVAKAVQAGGSIYKEPMDFGFMYGHSFQDLDGHQWELMFMEPNAVPGNA
ncbi:VOC family protein [Janthinobacterium sp. SUN176]|uniref:VOC family protein n=1 Tax=Janthinobacterium sp. SUN176 TaxID=3014788 RepID=UPI002713B9AB|nr:VOC family protein [Janthinobacterium sp. SUN176]MDO8073761.1 VOC family protein [Janthinobacterium sp. SUN176]